MSLFLARLAELSPESYRCVSHMMLKPGLTPQFEVRGGVYTDLSFTQIEPGMEESYGPFPSYKAAYTKWLEVARFKVDNARHRVTIVPV